MRGLGGNIGLLLAKQERGRVIESCLSTVTEQGLEVGSWAGQINNICRHQRQLARRRAAANSSSRRPVRLGLLSLLLPLNQTKMAMAQIIPAQMPAHR